ncbi:MAG: TetR/AcrR family transcriptional regulator [Clostridia bacterium]|nr:TetR/AcrR family transcriptional regulator [Clostridia bacterium]
MYCGSNKTALASQRQIAQALMRLINQKPYAQITISELCREAGISRQTFYTLFTSRENVVIFTLQAQYCYTPDLEREAPAERADDGECGVMQLCRGYSEYFIRNRSMLEILVENRIDHLLYDSIYEALDSCCGFLANLEPCQRRYAAGFYAGGLASIAKMYVREGCKCTSGELAQLMYSLITGRVCFASPRQK